MRDTASELGAAGYSHRGGLRPYARTPGVRIEAIELNLKSA